VDATVEAENIMALTLSAATKQLPLPEMMRVAVRFGPHDIRLIARPVPKPCPVAVAPVPRFPPRPDPRRHSLPAIHREVARWLRLQAVLWWVTTDRFMELCSQRI
jgi:hypothetical protein